MGSSPFFLFLSFLFHYNFVFLLGSRRPKGRGDPTERLIKTRKQSYKKGKKKKKERELHILFASYIDMLAPTAGGKGGEGTQGNPLLTTEKIFSRSSRSPFIRN